MECKVKSPLQIVSDEIELARFKRNQEERRKKIEDIVYKRIEREMHTKKFNVVFGKVMEKFGTQNAMQLLTESIEEIDSDSIHTLLKKKS